MAGQLTTILDNLQAQAEQHRRQLALIRGAIKKLRAASQPEDAPTKTNLAEAFKASGMSYCELARRVGCDRKTVTRAVLGKTKRSFIVPQLLNELGSK
jgi:hypothetical protein